MKENIKLAILIAVGIFMGAILVWSFYTLAVLKVQMSFVYPIVQQAVQQPVQQPVAK